MCKKSKKHDFALLKGKNSGLALSKGGGVWRIPEEGLRPIRKTTTLPRSGGEPIVKEKRTLSSVRESRGQRSPRCHLDIWKIDKPLGEDTGGSHLLRSSGGGKKKFKKKEEALLTRNKGLLYFIG